MNGVRLSVLPVGADAGTVVSLAERCDRAGLDGLWFGGLTAGSGIDPVDDAYVTTALAGAAARTRDIRLGALLDLAPDRAALTSAEDIGVLDQATGGRLEIGLVPHPGPAWADRAERVLGAWTSWPLEGYDVVVTPRPVQPVLPRLILSEDGGLRARLGAGRLVLAGSGSAASGGGRSVVVVHGRVPDGGDEEIGDFVASLRAAADSAGADEVVIAAPAQDLVGERAVRLLAGVVAPTVRCPADEVGVLLFDALAWWRRGAAA